MNADQIAATSQDFALQTQEVAMDAQPLALLGGMSAQRFMQVYWQKKPLLVRQAVAGFQPLLSQQELAELVQNDAVESRYIKGEGRQWQLQQGAFASWPIKPSYKKGKPAKPQTVLVQGVDTLHDGVHALMQRFRFVPDARLDDVMISYANVGGSVGPHFDSYDVFLLQAAGRRRWQVAENNSLALLPNMPLKLLADFAPEQEWVLEPGDMLYLPPQYAHHGVAMDDGCQTYSIGFRSPEKITVAADMAQRLGEWILDEYDDSEYEHYRDPQQAAVSGAPAAIPRALQRFATQTLTDWLCDGSTLHMLLGESLTEPKPNVCFVPSDARLGDGSQGVVLHPATRMMYDEAYIFANGESWQASGTEAVVLRQLADVRQLSQSDLDAAPEVVQALLDAWLGYGWLVLKK